MKKLMFVILAVMGLSLMGAMCDTDGSSGDTDSSSDIDRDILSWEIIFTEAPQSESCDASFIQSGADLGDPYNSGEMYLYHAPVVIQTGSEFDAYVPELHGLAYVLAGAIPTMGSPTVAPLPSPPLTVMPGDLVTVHFRFMADADARNGDFFEMRIYDDDFIMRPAFYTSHAVGNSIPNLEQIRGQSNEINYSFYARSGNLGLLFLVGLSSGADPMNPLSAPDQFYLDELTVTVNGNLIMYDGFEAGDYTQQGLAGAFVRLPLVPPNPVGAMETQGDLALEGSGSLAFTGGRYFVLYGLAANYDGVSAQLFSFSDPNVFNPFYGEAQTTVQTGLMVGRYQGWSRSTPDIDGWCAEGGLNPPVPPNIMLGTGLSFMELLMGANP